MADRRPMRRANREMLERADLDDVLVRAEVLYLAINDTPAPYVVPLAFGWADGSLWLHCAAEGTKLELMRRSPEVGFAAAAGVRIVAGAAACDCAATGRSVVGRGRARIVTAEAERRRGLDALMAHYGAAPPYAYRSASLERTCVVRVDVSEIRGRRVG